MPLSLLFLKAETAPLHHVPIKSYSKNDHPPFNLNRIIVCCILFSSVYMCKIHTEFRVNAHIHGYADRIIQVYEKKYIKQVRVGENMLHVNKAKSMVVIESRGR